MSRQFRTCHSCQQLLSTWNQPLDTRFPPKLNFSQLTLYCIVRGAGSISCNKRETSYYRISTSYILWIQLVLERQAATQWKEPEELTATIKHSKAIKNNHQTWVTEVEPTDMTTGTSTTTHQLTQDTTATQETNRNLPSHPTTSPTPTKQPPLMAIPAIFSPGRRKNGSWRLTTMPWWKRLPNTMPGLKRRRRRS